MIIDYYKSLFQSSIEHEGELQREIHLRRFSSSLYCVGSKSMSTFMLVNYCIFTHKWTTPWLWQKKVKHVIGPYEFKLSGVTTVEYVHWLKSVCGLNIPNIAIYVYDSRLTKSVITCRSLNVK